jgi:acyl-coenzyme A synthetase/AMP-(fatty) acid ligase/acyl carrier protein
VSFDAAVWEIWPYLAAGATLCIPGSDVRKDAGRLQQWILSERITVAFAPTVLAERLILMDWPRKTALRILLTGGEALRTYPRRDLPFTFVNNYGPTECTVVATSGIVAPDEKACTPPSIGHPIQGVQAYVLDEDMKPLRSGQSGELYLGGSSLAVGYHNRPHLTAEKFIFLPLHQGSLERVYRTGDIVRMGNDGQLHFVGRADNQVKIRGFRIEPDEVAATICLHPAVRQCIVVGRDSERGEKELIAYVTQRGKEGPGAQELRDFLAKKLPDYMIPSWFVALEELPLTPNGKVDVAALPVPDRNQVSGLNSPLNPRTHLERQIAALVASLLKVRTVGVEDNFFLLGGHSLFGAELIGRLAKEFHVEIPLRALFEAPTVEKLACEVERLRAARPSGLPADRS